MALFRRHVGEGGEPTTWHPSSRPAAAQRTDLVPLTEGGGRVHAAEPRPVAGSNRDLRRRLVDVCARTLRRHDDVLQAAAKQPKDLHRRGARFPQTRPQAASAARTNCRTADDRGRSFAGTLAGAYGERVNTGLRRGSMRLNGTPLFAVERSGLKAHEDVGGSFGSAFSTPARDGRPGSLAVHLTLGEYRAVWTLPRLSVTAARARPRARPAVAPSQRSAGRRTRASRPATSRVKAGRRKAPRDRPAGHENASPACGGVAIPSRPTRSGPRPDVDLGGETGRGTGSATPLNSAGTARYAFDPNNSARGYAVGQRASFSPTQDLEQNQNRHPQPPGEQLHVIASRARKRS